MPKSIWEMEFKDLVSANLTKIESGISKTFSKIEALDHGLKNLMGSSHAVVAEHESMVGSLVKAGAELFAVEKVMEWGKEIFNAGIKMEGLKVQMETLTSSVKAGDEAFEQLSDMYKKFPILGKENIMAAGEQLLEMKMPIEEITKRMKQMGDISGGDGGHLTGLVDNLKRAVGFGSVQARQLMSQPALLAQIEKQHNMNGIQIKKFLAEGEVGVEDLYKAFDVLTSKGGQFYKMLDNRMDSTGGKLAKMKMRFEELGERLFNKLQPYVNSVLDLADKYWPKVEWALKKAWQMGHDVFDFYQEHAELFNDLAIGVAIYAGGMAIATVATWGLEAALAAVGAANPFGALAMALGALFVSYDDANFGATTLMDNLQDLKTWFVEAWGWMTRFWSDIGTNLKGVAQIIDGIMHGNWGEIKTGWGAMGTNTSGAYLKERDIVDDKLKDNRLFRDKGTYGAYEHTMGNGPLNPNAGPTLPYVFGSENKKDDEAKEKSKEGYHPLAPGAGGDATLSGETKIRNVIVHINGGLVHTINVHAATLKEGAGQIKETVARALVDTVRDSELALGQS